MGSREATDRLSVDDKCDCGHYRDHHSVFFFACRRCECDQFSMDRATPPARARMGETLTTEKLRRLSDKLPEPEIREVVVDPDAHGDSYYRTEDSFVMPHNLWLRFRALTGPPKEGSPTPIHGVPVRREPGAYHDAVALHRLQRISECRLRHPTTEEQPDD